MTAGSGIAIKRTHRTGRCGARFRLHGVQTWVALPKAQETQLRRSEHVEAGTAAVVAKGEASSAPDRRPLRWPHGADDAFSPIFTLAPESCR